VDGDKILPLSTVFNKNDFYIATTVCRGEFEFPDLVNPMEKFYLAAFLPSPHQPTHANAGFYFREALGSRKKRRG
jgi:hypothetical protein